MQNAIILHGKVNQTKYHDTAFASPSNASWLPWIQKQLLMHDVLAQTPEMPTPWKPEYSAWARDFERYSITPETNLVGHSCGAGFIVRWLSEHGEIHVRKVILVAPWLDPDRTGDTGDFFNFTMDPRLTERSAKITILSSSDDFPGALISTKMIKEAIPGINVREFNRYGHFTQITEFLELRDELLN